MSEEERDEILGRAMAMAHHEFETVKQELNGQNVRVHIGSSIRDSRVWVNGKPLMCYGIEAKVEGGGDASYSRLKLAVAGPHLQRKIIAEGTFHVENVTFSDPLEAMEHAKNEARWIAEHPVKVYRINDYEWYAARSLDNAIRFAADQAGMKMFEVADQPNVVSDEQMQMLDYVEDDGTRVTFAEKLRARLEGGDEPPFFFASTEQ